MLAASDQCHAVKIQAISGHTVSRLHLFPISQRTHLHNVILSITAHTHLHTVTMHINQGTTYNVPAGHWKSKLSNQCPHYFHVVANGSEVQGIQTTLQPVSDHKSWHIIRQSGTATLHDSRQAQLTPITAFLSHPYVVISSLTMSANPYLAAVRTPVQPSLGNTNWNRSINIYTTICTASIGTWMLYVFTDFQVYRRVMSAGWVKVH